MELVSITSVFIGVIPRRLQVNPHQIVGKPQFTAIICSDVRHRLVKQFRTDYLRRHMASHESLNHRIGGVVMADMGGY